jgi:hypothetical protein
MTEPDAAGTEIQDFTIKREPHRFRIDDDVFEAPPLLAPFVIRKLAALHSQLGDNVGELMTTDDGVERLLTIMGDMFRYLLPGPSGKRFVERLNTDGDPGDSDADPPVPASPASIDLLGQVLPVLYWLLERYGLRPTVPSSDSSDGSTVGATGSPSAGISSTAGASPEAFATIN